MLVKYKKLDSEKFSIEKYGSKAYLSSMKLSESRTFYSARAMVLRTIKYNFKGNPEYAAADYMCECNEHRDDQESLLTCTLYEHLREGLDVVNSDHDLVKYYMLVIEDRSKEK